MNSVAEKTDTIWGLGRGGRLHKPNAERKKLSVIFAETVCGKHLRDIKMMLVGSQGSGKSRSLLYLAVECAKEIAARTGGDPEDYFPSDLSNVVIGDPGGHAELFKNMKRHSILILDDAGVSMNARNFATQYNKSMNDVFQTMRPNRSIVLISTPDTMTTDIIIRTLVSHYGEVAESYHGLGFNDIKVFKVNRKFRTGETHYHYFIFGNEQVVRYRFYNPPQAIIKLYEEKRFDATQAIAANAGKVKTFQPKEPLPEKTCIHCGYTWIPKVSAPKKCPQCNSIHYTQEPAPPSTCPKPLPS
jgi:predicted Zn-ribbon and HTH transcriptional regulator